jgi:hypothetical protein
MCCTLTWVAAVAHICITRTSVVLTPVNRSECPQRHDVHMHPSESLNGVTIARFFCPCVSEWPLIRGSVSDSHTKLLKAAYWFLLANFYPPPPLSAMLLFKQRQAQTFYLTANRFHYKRSINKVLRFLGGTVGWAWRHPDVWTSGGSAVRLLSPLRIGR